MDDHRAHAVSGPRARIPIVRAVLRDEQVWVFLHSHNDQWHPLSDHRWRNNLEAILNDWLKLSYFFINRTWTGSYSRPESNSALASCDLPMTLPWIVGEILPSSLPRTPQEPTIDIGTGVKEVVTPHIYEIHLWFLCVVVKYEFGLHPSFQAHSI